MSSGDDRPLPRRLLAATRGTAEELGALVFDGSEEVLRALVANPALEEADLLLLLERKDLSTELLRQVAADVARTRSYKVKLALLRNPRTPASASLKFVPHVYPFDLVSITLLPHVPREVKAAAEASLLQRLKEMPLGVRVTLARRTSSEGVLARLLADPDRQVVEAVMPNARLTEGIVVRAIRHPSAPAHTIDVVSRSSRWSVRHDVRFALLRSRHLPLARALAFLGTMNREDVSMLIADPAVPAQLRAYLARRR
jgi:hypothetical protein